MEDFPPSNLSKKCTTVSFFFISGSFQPSYDLQLKFYAYFKQATEGANHYPKPSFWEVVKKAKWDAWTRLGNMTKEEAMTHYVDELRRVSF